MYKDAENFSKISGDFNPLHLSNEFASKSIHGERIVHGLNVIFWALDSFYINSNYNKLKKININFNKTIFFKKNVFLEVFKKEGNSYNFSVFDDYESKVSFSILIGPKFIARTNLRHKVFKKVLPREITLENQKSKLMYTDIQFNKKIFKSEFKNLYKKIDHFVIGSLLSTTKIVGMEAPGKYSRYISLKSNINFKEKSLSYKLQSFDDRFGFLNLNLKGILNGNIEAIKPQKPIHIISIFEITQLLKKYNFNLKSYFKNKKILIIGGSRGIGAYLVKVLALQGAEVLFSYNNNKKDSSKIIKELRNVKKMKVKAFKMNILKNNFNNIKSFKADYVFYMATPQIGKINDKKIIDTNKLSLFYKFYIKGFLNIYNFYNNCNRKIKFLYPSTTLVNKIKPINSEYLIIKRLGEEICNSLNKKNSLNKRVIVSKIKPLLTDQHLSLYDNITLDNPLKETLFLIREIKSSKF